MILDRVATRKEHNNLLLRVLLQKSEEEEEPLFGGTNNVSLGECRDSAGLCHLVDVDGDGTRSERYPREILRFVGLSGGE